MKNILETIKTDDVIAVRFDYSAITGKPMLCVDTYDEDEIQHYLDDSFKIHECNEFLRSLDTGIDIEFSGFVQYRVQISLINNLLPIKRMMETVTAKKYAEISITADMVHTHILDELFSKHGMGTMLWEDVMKIRPLEEWVSEAIADLT